MLDCRRRREVMLWHSHVCWTVANWSFFPCSWGSEAWVYQRIHELQNNVFCKILDHGEILCPSVFLKGYILVISMAEGEPLSVIWDDLACPNRIMFVHNAAKPYPSFAASPYGLQTRARRTLFFEEDECCYDGGSGGNLLMLMHRRCSGFWGAYEGAHWWVQLIWLCC